MIAYAAGGDAWQGATQGAIGGALGGFTRGFFMNRFAQVCFVAGTPLVMDLDGNSKPIEEIQVGEFVLARSEFDPAGPLELKRVDELFTRTSEIVELELAGRVIGTTVEHPFFVPARGEFIPAKDLQVGDELISHDGRLIKLDAIRSTPRVTTVYNMRVADHHTYFVGGSEWGFDVWVHNATCKKLVESSSEVPSRKNGAFDEWFDSLSARTVKVLYKNDAIREVIEKRLRGDGGLHEYLMVATAPVWKKWGVSMSEFRKMTTSIDELNEGLAKGWVHSTGGLADAKNSKRVHNQLQKIIERSSTLDEFKENIKPWARKWLNNGTRSLPSILRG